MTESERQMLARVAARAAARNMPIYVVGGALRDALLGRSRRPLNIDLAVPSGALELGKELAQELGGAYICLDEATRTARVVVGADDGKLELDIADFRGPTLEQDLALRDFRINALALPLDAWRDDATWSSRLIDPMQGRADLSAKRLTPCFPGTFADDAVRILRAFRFSVELDFTLDPSAQPLMAEAAPKLARVAGERIRDELFAILQTDRASDVLRQLDALRVVDVIFPDLVHGRGLDQGGYHHLDVLGHQLEAVAQADRLLKDFAEFDPAFREPFAAYFAETLVERRTRKALVKLGSLYHDVGKPGTRRVTDEGEIWFIGHEHFGANLVGAMLERLRLSKRESELITRLVLHHLRPGHLSREPQLTPRAIFRFFRDLEDDGPACLMLWWADRLATRGPLSNVKQIDEQRARLEELFRAYFFKPEEAVRPPKLIDGTALMRGLGLKPGPAIGQLLHAIQEAQAEGRVKTQDQALEFAKEMLKR